MNLQKSLSVVFCVLNAGCAASGGQYMSCALHKTKNELDLNNVKHFVYTEASVNSVPVQMIVDTGADTSILPADMSDTLSLTTRPVHLELSSISESVSHDAQVYEGDVTIGKMIFRGFSFVIKQIDHSEIKKYTNTNNKIFIGLIGTNILYGDKTLDIDVAHEKLTVYYPPYCWENEKPSGPTATDIPVKTVAGTELVPVSLNGVSGDGLIDTGSENTVMTTEFANKLGVTDEELANDPKVMVKGIDGIALVASKHRFDGIKIGNLSVGTDVDVGNFHPRAGADILLGLDIWQKVEIWHQPDTDHVTVKINAVQK